MLVQFKRGLDAAKPAGSDGEPLFTTDTHKLFVGYAGANYEIGGSGGAPFILAIGGSVSGAVSQQFLYVDSSLTLRQAGNFRYSSGWPIFKDQGPPALGDLVDGEFAISFTAGPP